MGIQTVISAFWRLVRFHLGTAAFGSFIIALIRVIWWLKKTDMAERGEVLDSLDTTQLSAAQNVTQSLVGGVSTAKSQEEVTFFLVAAIIATIKTVSPQI